MRRRHVGSLWFFVAAAACEADQGDPHRAETDHLVVHSIDPQPLCRGTPEILEREVLRIATRLDVSLPSEKVQVVLGREAKDEYCEFATDVEGCAGHDDAGVLLVAGEIEPITHELVHAVRLATHSNGPLFYEEGLAESYRAGEVISYQIGSPPPEETFRVLQSEFSGEVVDYLVSGNFVSWLRQRFGDEAIAAAFSSPAFVQVHDAQTLAQWFEASLGEGLVEAKDQWSGALPMSFYFPGPCTNGHSSSLQSGSFIMFGRVDCDSEPQTIGPRWHGDDVYVSTIDHCVDVEGVSRFSLEFVAPPDATLTMLPRSCDTGKPILVDQRSLQGGHFVEIETDACWVQVSVERSSLEPFDFSWSVEPA